MAFNLLLLCSLLIAFAGVGGCGNAPAPETDVAPDEVKGPWDLKESIDPMTDEYSCFVQHSQYNGFLVRADDGGIIYASVLPDDSLELSRRRIEAIRDCEYRITVHDYPASPNTAREWRDRDTRKCREDYSFEEYALVRIGGGEVSREDTKSQKTVLFKVPPASVENDYSAKIAFRRYIRNKAVATGASDSKREGRPYEVSTTEIYLTGINHAVALRRECDRRKSSNARVGDKKLQKIE